MTQATTPAIDTDIYVRNLCALWETDPRLAMAIEAVRALEIPHLEPLDEMLEGQVIH